MARKDDPRDSDGSDDDSEGLDDAPSSTPSQPTEKTAGTPPPSSDQPLSGSVSFQESGLQAKKEATVSAPSLLSPQPKRPGAGAARLRSSVLRVMQLNRASSTLQSLGIGAEPGIDPRRSAANATFGHIRRECSITVTDYSRLRATTTQMGNKDLIDFLKDENKCKKDAWVRVRWINIGGLSWDVLSAVAIRYDLHPLALEDVLHQRSQARSKADYYLNHIFVRVLRHQLGEDDESVDGIAANVIRHTITGLPRSMSPVGFHEGDSDDEDRTLAGSKFNSQKVVGEEAFAGGDMEKGPPPNGAAPAKTRTSSLLRSVRLLPCACYLVQLILRIFF